ncbi:MAG: isoamylase [Moritella sp.]|jgi:isoamylase
MSKPYPLGASLLQTNDITGTGCNFAIYAPACSSLQLVLFNGNQQRRFVMQEKYAGVHHIFIADVSAGQEYGYAANINEQDWLLIDPYAKSLSAAPYYQPPYSASKSWKMAKAMVTDSSFDWQAVAQPNVPLNATVLLETHTKGFSQLNPAVTTAQPGSYMALCDPANIRLLQQQGITSVQLLPVATCMHEPHLLTQKGVNYWGYSPLVFMAPDPRFAEKNAVIELKTAVRELHRNGIEIILDVVYNHTAEGGIDDPIFNLKALDSRYYLQDKAGFKNHTGCGNTLNLSHQASLNLVMDSLRHWVKEYHIDGFRFDLAATLGRNGDSFNPQAAFFQAVAQDPQLQQTKLIAEPWDIGPNGYQLGYFPDGWNECNDKFRDTVRSFWRGDAGYLKDLATRIMGSRHFFSGSRWPHKLSVNYITYHDGFTLRDLVSYNDKHNLANGENNRDGHGDNRSYNGGAEGDTDNRAIIALRQKQKRNLMATLLFSFGIPHLLAADMVSHSQSGNNNAYCQDNEISWLNWQMNDIKQAFQDWLSAMVKARKQYMLPFIQAFSGDDRHANRIYWYCSNGTKMQQADWDHKTSLALHLGLGVAGNELLLLFNQGDVAVDFQLPSGSQAWQLICDTNSTQLPESNSNKCVSDNYHTIGRSMVILHRTGSESST